MARGERPLLRSRAERGRRRRRRPLPSAAARDASARPQGEAPSLVSRRVRNAADPDHDGRARPADRHPDPYRAPLRRRASGVLGAAPIPRNFPPLLPLDRPYPRSGSSGCSDRWLFSSGSTASRPSASLLPPDCLAADSFGPVSAGGPPTASARTPLGGAQRRPRGSQNGYHALNALARRPHPAPCAVTEVTRKDELKSPPLRRLRGSQFYFGRAAGRCSGYFIPGSQDPARRRMETLIEVDSMSAPAPPPIARPRPPDSGVHSKKITPGFVSPKGTLLFH